MRRIVFLAGMAALLGLSGCKATGLAGNRALPGGAAYTYQGGTASQPFGMSPTVVERAASSAMDDLNMSAITMTREPDASILRGTTADNRTATVTIRPGGNLSTASVRVGWFGDEALSKAVLDRMGIRLGTMPAQAIPTASEIPSTPESNPVFSREAVSDSVMLRGQAAMGNRDAPGP